MLRAPDGFRSLTAASLRFEDFLTPCLRSLGPLSSDLAASSIPMDVSEANAASSGAARDDHAQLDHDVASGPRGDQAMTDDMRLAISALGLLRSEGATASGDNEAPSDSLTARPRPSTSTASTSTASDAWGTGSSSSTLLQSSGASSPLTTTSIAPSDVGPQADHSDRTGGSDDVEGDAKFIERVSQLPLVSGGLEWYERSKASSRVVKASFHPARTVPLETPLLTRLTSRLSHRRTVWRRAG